MIIYFLKNDDLLSNFFSEGQESWSDFEVVLA